MMFSSRVLRSWICRFVQPLASRKTLRKQRSRSSDRQPFLEVLEDRTAPAVFTVTNTGDNGGVNPASGAGTGTLRQAIINADAADSGTAANPDTIQFCIPTTDPSYNSAMGTFTIQTLSALPTVTDTVDIDGYTQPGANPNTLTNGDNAVLNIVLDGDEAGAVDGLVIGASNCTVSGLVIDNFAVGAGINLGVTYQTRLGGNDLIIGDFIGTDATGESAMTNSNGILIWSADNAIGGVTPEDRNIISGNNSMNTADPGAGGSFGINIGYYGTLIEGNYIGTDKSGTIALPNAYGINVSGWANTIIGGTLDGSGNVVSGNLLQGIGQCNQDLVAGNLIGTNATGAGAIGNGGAGIDLDGDNTIIGGTTPEACNIVSGNALGIEVEAGQYNTIEGNYIGTDITGAEAVGNQGGIVIEGANNTVGGTVEAARNIISGNGAGIEIGWGGSFTNNISNNTIIGNYIGTDVSGTHAVPNSTALV